MAALLLKLTDKLGAQFGLCRRSGNLSELITFGPMRAAKGISLLTAQDISKTIGKLTSPGQHIAFVWMLQTIDRASRCGEVRFQGIGPCSLRQSRKNRPSRAGGNPRRFPHDRLLNRRRISRAQTSARRALLISTQCLCQPSP